MVETLLHLLQRYKFSVHRKKKTPQLQNTSSEKETEEVPRQKHYQNKRKIINKNLKFTICCAEKTRDSRRRIYKITSIRQSLAEFFCGKNLKKWRKIGDMLVIISQFY